MKEVTTLFPLDKKECYPMIHSTLKALFEKEVSLIPNLSNASALLNQALVDINWVGFYLLVHNELVLGPFQGKTACIRIPIGKGVCGTAVLNNKTQRIKDVCKFPGHIACDSASRSEIVIPIYNNGKVVGVLDIDSPILSRFDEIDQEGLEEVARILETHCNWDKYF